MSVAWYKLELWVIKSEYQDINRQLWVIKSEYQDINWQFWVIKSEYQDINWQLWVIKSEYQDINWQLQEKSQNCEMKTLTCSLANASIYLTIMTFFLAIYKLWNLILRRKRTNMFSELIFVPIRVFSGRISSGINYALRFKVKVSLFVTK